jgi:hypothetical protein
VEEAHGTKRGTPCNASHEKVRAGRGGSRVVASLPGVTRVRPYAPDTPAVTPMHEFVFDTVPPRSAPVRESHTPGRWRCGVNFVINWWMSRYLSVGPPRHDPLFWLVLSWYRVTGRRRRCRYDSTPRPRIRRPVCDRRPA